MTANNQLTWGQKLALFAHKVQNLDGSYAPWVHLGIFLGPMAICFILCLIHFEHSDIGEWKRLKMLGVPILGWVFIVFIAVAYCEKLFMRYFVDSGDSIGRKVILEVDSTTDKVVASTQGQILTKAQKTGNYVYYIGDLSWYNKDGLQKMAEIVGADFRLSLAINLNFKVNSQFITQEVYDLLAKPEISLINYFNKQFEQAISKQQADLVTLARTYLREEITKFTFLTEVLRLIEVDHDFSNLEVLLSCAENPIQVNFYPKVKIAAA
ncbi:MAG: hypothetical protein NTZ49_05690 [Candidatus Parcubacteria bacterium]|nr:hypothetical protein [Candidatus Parcubacteria bacterium]